MEKKEKLSTKALLAIIAAGLFTFCGVLIETATNITFPTLMNEFHVTTSTVQWMTTGNLLVLGILIPISSYLKKRFPTKNLFLAAGFIFLTGLILDVIASDFMILLTGRIIQGAGVGIALPMMYNIILDEAPEHMLGMLMGVGSFVIGSAPALGPTFGGIMIQYFNWRYIFGVIIPFIIFATALGYFCIRKNTGEKCKIDIPGFIFIALAFIALIMGFSNLDQILLAPLMIIGEFVLGFGLLALFIYRSTHNDDPLISFDIFKSKGFSLHIIAIMTLQMTTLGLGLIIPSFVQIVFGQNATDSGLVLLPGAIIAALGAVVSGIIYDKFGAKLPLLTGSLFVVVSLVLYLFNGSALSSFTCMIFYLIYSIGQSLLVGNTLTRALSLLPEDMQADGNATIQTLQQLSGAIGTSICAAILAFSQSSDLIIGTQSGTINSFIFLLVLTIIVLVSQFIALKED